MRRMGRGGLVICLVLGLGPAARAQTQAVIYPDGRVFVRRTIVHPLARGTTVVPLPNDPALPGSLIALDSGVVILSARTPAASDPASLLRKAVGRRIVFRMSASDTVGAVVLSADPIRFQLADGAVVVSMPGIILFPPDIAAPSRLSSMTVQSAVPRPGVEVGYVMNGIWWQAHYTLTLAGRRGRLTAGALLTSGGVSLDSAEILLLDGAISRMPANSAALDGPVSLSQPSVVARSLEERQRLAVPSPTPANPTAGVDGPVLYRLPGRVTIHASEIASFPLMGDAAVEVVRVLSVPGLLPTLPPGRVAGGTTQLPVSTVYHLTGKAISDPQGTLPPGTARIFGPAGSGPTILIGEGVVPEPSSAGRLDVSAGPSGEVLAMRTASEAIAEQDTVLSASGSRTVRTAAIVYEEILRLQNLTDSALVVELVEQRQGAWSVVSSTVPPESVADGVVRFRIPLPGRRVTSFTARLRVPVP